MRRRPGNPGAGNGEMQPGEITMQKQLFRAGAGAAVAFIAACGGGNKDGAAAQPTGAVPMASTADAVRELGNISTTTGLLSLSTGAGAQGAVARSFREVQRASVFGAAAPWQARLEAPRAVSNCSGGGTDDQSSGSKSYSFTYFNTSGTVSYVSNNYSGCTTANSDGSSTTLDHQVEAGSTADDSLGYVLFGAGGTPAHIKTFATGASLDEDLLGQIQVSAGTDSGTSRGVLQMVLDGKQTGYSDYQGSFFLGSGDAFYGVTQGQSSISFDGVYAYSSNGGGDSGNVCGGGAVTLSTPSTLVLGQTGYGTNFPVGGSLVLVTGSSKVTFTFNADGSATLSGNVAGTLSSGDVDQALINGSPC